MNINTEENKDHLHKDQIEYHVRGMQFEERLETLEEVKLRKEETERLAALEKGAKKKAPPKGKAGETDPADEPQMIKVPIENVMDMGYLMPLYTKWVTS